MGFWNDLWDGDFDSIWDDAVDDVVDWVSGAEDSNIAEDLAYFDGNDDENETDNFDVTIGGTTIGITGEGDGITPYPKPNNKSNDYLVYGGFALGMYLLYNYLT